MLVAAAVEEPPRTSPPAAPAIGACYIVAPGATGAWTGKQQCLAAYSSGGWRFITPVEGASAYVRSTGTCAIYRSGEWELGKLRASSVLISGVQVVGSRGGPIAAPSGGTVVDTEARAAISQILTTMRQHGLIET